LLVFLYFTGFLSILEYHLNCSFFLPCYAGFLSVLRNLLRRFYDRQKIFPIFSPLQYICSICQD
jgi:hypothetical protein